MYGPQQHGLMFGSSYLNHLDMSSQLGSWYEHPLQNTCILQHSPISMWFYPCSYICNCLKMSKKSQINEYSYRGNICIEKTDGLNIHSCNLLLRWINLREPYYWFAVCWPNSIDNHRMIRNSRTQHNWEDQCIPLRKINKLALRITVTY